MPDYEIVIGLEIHIQLSTKTKMFCSCPVMGYDEIPNTATCPICLGYPGALPVPNKQAIDYATMLALALNCNINRKSIFARKNYFYPDLPKGYQITQDEIPFATNGQLEFELPDGSKKVCRIKRIHLEEDAGKSIHSPMGKTLIDFNRCGVPLIEIVSEPDLNSPQEASAYVSTLRQLVIYLGICAGDMEKGHLRVDANISVRPSGEKTLGNRTELKNLNSFRFLQRALEFEINRHIEILGSGGKIQTETLLWDQKKGETRPMRTKEEASDYRYFPEPDLLPLVLTEEIIERARKNLPELPAQRIARFEKDYELEHTETIQLCADKEFSEWADIVLKNVSNKKLATNWLLTELFAILNDRKCSVGELPFGPVHFAQLVNMLDNKRLSGPLAKDILAKMTASGEEPEKIVKQLNIEVVSDTSVIEKIADEVIFENPDVVAKYKKGKMEALGFLVGQIMKKTKGRAEPKSVNEILKKKLG